MPRIAYVNGQYVPHGDAMVHIEDRGYQFSDGVYEVTLALGGRLLDEDRHLARLGRSLAALDIAPPLAKSALKLAMRKLVALNRLPDALLYQQVTRGVAPRGHAFPKRPVRPALVMTVRRFDPAAVAARQAAGAAVVTAPDLRWRRCDIKSVSLLGNVLAKQAAAEAGAQEAWMVDDVGVTEGASTTAWIVTEGGEVVSRHLSQSLLPGVTRAVIADALAPLGVRFVERPFTVAEAQAAAEAFFTSTTSFVMPVTSIDGQTVADGRPGPVTRAIQAAHWAHVRAATGRPQPPR
ncbi:D-amino acid aminotransferase [Rhodothalassium salexigens]|uniref:D-amino-acid transaminase n=1 Tax=Rhodothalassium salexigens TaxID=1086 RepID=UPI00191287D0|nr:D-amino-acid transaminase [Rhodothalassium salexigens]MBK5912249.1 D-amino acid aminotransferase [Rhodothalassium salexigens]